MLFGDYIFANVFWTQRLTRDQLKLSRATKFWSQSHLSNWLLKQWRTVNQSYQFILEEISAESWKTINLQGAYVSFCLIFDGLSNQHGRFLVFWILIGQIGRSGRPADRWKVIYCENESVTLLELALSRTLWAQTHFLPWCSLYFSAHETSTSL